MQRRELSLPLLGALPVNLDQLREDRGRFDQAAAGAQEAGASRQQVDRRVLDVERGLHEQDSARKPRAQLPVHVAQTRVVRVRFELARDHRDSARAEAVLEELAHRLVDLPRPLRLRAVRGRGSGVIGREHRGDAVLQELLRSSEVAEVGEDVQQAEPLSVVSALL